MAEAPSEICVKLTIDATELRMSMAKALRDMADQIEGDKP